MPTYILNITIDEHTQAINVPEELLQQATDLFKKMNDDMDNGWQMSREWVEKPNPTERCQIVADKMLTALETEKQALAQMMAAYILHTLPNIIRIDINTTGNIQETDIILTPHSVS